MSRALNCLKDNCDRDCVDADYGGVVVGLVGYQSHPRRGHRLLACRYRTKFRTPLPPTETAFLLFLFPLRQNVYRGAIATLVRDTLF